MGDTLNPGMPLDLARVRAARVNQPAVARRIAALNGSRSVKKDFQAAWHVRAIQCLDLTTLAGDDTQRFALHPEGAQPLRAFELDASRPIVLAVGPEGGFGERDLDALAQGGFQRLSLGPRILRTETAGLAAIAALQVVLGDLA